MGNLVIGQKVNADITQKGYYKNTYQGEVVGFTTDGRVKVKSWKGVKTHSVNNVRPTSI